MEREAADSEVYFEGLSQLAEIELEYGDPQAAAALYIDFLNWAREPGHSTEAEAILTAFDQIIELAESDGAQNEAAAVYPCASAILSRGRRRRQPHRSREIGNRTMNHMSCGTTDRFE